MPFIIDDSEVIQESPAGKPNNEFLSGYPKAAAKLAAIPVSRTAETVGGLAGGAIEAVPNLVNSIYSFLGKEGPEWTKGPVSARVTEEGKINPYLRTPQEIREEVTKPRFGEYTEPSNEAERLLSEGADIGSSLATSGITNPKSLLKATAAGLGVREAAKESGAPPIFSVPAEVAATWFFGKTSKPSYVAEETTKKGSELAKTAQAEGITSAPAAILAEGKNDWTSKFLRFFGKGGEEVRQRAQSFVNQIEEAHHNVLAEIHSPYKTERNLSALKKQAGRLFDPVKQIANQNPVPVSKSPIIESIRDNINTLKSSKSLSAGEKAAVKILEDFETELLNGEFNLNNAESTYRSFQKHVKDWDSITKNDSHLINVQKKLREEMLNSGKAVPGFNEAFDLANIGYHNYSKLESATAILKDSFTSTGRFDPRKFIETIKNKEKRTELMGVLGKQNLDRMTKIANLTEAGAKNFAEVGALLPEDIRIQNKILGHHMGLGKGLTGLLERSIGENFAAKILTNPNLQENYLGYLNSLKRNQKKMAAYYLRKIGNEVDLSPEPEEKGFVVD